MKKILFTILLFSAFVRGQSFIELQGGVLLEGQEGLAAGFSYHTPLQDVAGLKFGYSFIHQNSRIYKSFQDFLTVEATAWFVRDSNTSLMMLGGFMYNSTLGEISPSFGMDLIFKVDPSVNIKLGASVSEYSSQVNIGFIVPFIKSNNYKKRFF